MIYAQIAERHQHLWTTLFDAIHNNHLFFEITNLFTLNTNIEHNRDQPYTVILKCHEEHSITHNIGTITEIFEQLMDSKILSVVYINAETDDQMFFSITAIADFTDPDTWPSMTTEATGDPIE